MKTRRFSVITIALVCAMCAFGQTTTTAAATAPALPALQNAAIPTYVMMGISYNQYASPSVSGLFSAIEPESQSVGLLASESVDLLPVQYTDPATKKTGYLIAGSVRFGQHKVLLNTAKAGPFAPSFVLTIGGDAGAAFTSTPSTGTQPSSIAVAFSGSFTIGAFYRFKPHWAIGAAVRALYVAGAGPNGSGALNPVVEPGLVYCK